MASLTKKNKTECQVIFILMVTSLLLREVDKEAGKQDEEDGPATQQCILLMDELLQRNDEKTRNLMVKRINNTRVWLTKRIKDKSTQSALIGALTVLTSGFYKSKPGTRFDLIIGQFRKNLPNLTLLVKYNAEEADEIAEHLKDAIRRIG